MRELMKPVAYDPAIVKICRAGMKKIQVAR